MFNGRNSEGLLTLGLGSLNEITDDLLKGLDLGGSQSDSDLVDLWSLSQVTLLSLLVRHRRRLDWFLV
jgi:hypothetical protein